MGTLQKLFAIFVTLIYCGIPAIAQHFIPVPEKIEYPNKGQYHISANEQIHITHPTLQNEAQELQTVLEQRCGIPSSIIQSIRPAKRNITLQIDTTIGHSEGYKLTVTTNNIRITGKTPAGVFYGIRTLDQLLLGDGGQSLHTTIPCIEITDSPRYSYRALMLDPARHFIPFEDVKQFIETMSHYKYNTLQLHLTDDQGWRIEIKAYPELTQRGAFRRPGASNQGPDNGYYTQQQIKALIDYAAKKHIQIIPELDIPGHTVAAIVSHPELGCRHMDTVPIQFGKTADRTLCAAKDNIYDFYANILQEIAALFPAKQIHLGGDEAVIDKNWGKCPDCQQLMQKQGYKETREIMGYFFERIHRIVKQNNKELMLWCELDNIRMPAKEYLFPYPKDCTLFTWRLGLTPKAIELTRQAGNKLIASPGEHCYLDYPQYKNDFPEFNNWGMPLLTLEDSYNWDPGYGLPAEQQAHIVGVAGLLWAEAMLDINRVTYMAYPRALALAEAAWSKMDKRNWETFKTNLFPHLSDLMRQGISFRVPFELNKSKEK